MSRIICITDLKSFISKESACIQFLEEWQYKVRWFFSKSHTSNRKSMSSTRRMAAPTNRQYQPLCTNTKKKFKLYFYLPFTEQDKQLLYLPSNPGRGPHHKCLEMWESSWSLQIPPRLSLCQRDRQQDSILFVCTWVIGFTKCREWFTTKTTG